SSRERVAERQRELEQGVCLACATFGGPGLASHFRFQDAVAAPGHAVRQRDGVAIDRDLGRVAGSRKYDFEVIEAGARFPFVVVMENPRDWQIGLLLSALDLLDDGLIRVGGFGSRGLGLVRLAGEPRLVRRSLEDILDGREGTLLDEDRRQACRKALLAEVRHALRGKEGC
ncbi:MAG: hypothetical protein FJ125_04465, partial [Deltaproteobacteria bacterium]|nr:hypothetical protein [Deltaproteobacteria bacterium]